MKANEKNVYLTLSARGEANQNFMGSRIENIHIKILDGE